MTQDRRAAGFLGPEGGDSGVHFYRLGTARFLLRASSLHMSFS